MKEFAWFEWFDPSPIEPVSQGGNGVVSREAFALALSTLNEVVGEQSGAKLFSSAQMDALVEGVSVDGKVNYLVFLDSFTIVDVTKPVDGKQENGRKTIVH